MHPSIHKYDTYDDVISSRGHHEVTDRGRRREREKVSQSYRNISKSPPTSTEFREGMLALDYYLL